MDRDQLRERQRPLRERYTADPASAVVTLSAEGSLAGSDVTCSVRTGRALVEAGLHPATGGDGSFACSGDMLLEALVACAGVTLRAVATNRDLRVTGTVKAEGDLDFRGTLGVDRAAPVGFRAIRLTFDLESDAGQEDLDGLVATTERYCVVLQTLANGSELSVART
ncbi:MAG TPA: OsmC family protein [Acidimicrobiales bacterium]|nr:OsmC family protein [Acidimicrobiales bacterium]